MKKTFLAKRNALLSGGGLSSGIFILAIAFSLLLFRLIAPNIFLHTAAPFFNFSNSLSEKSHYFFAAFGNASKLTESNEKLISENNALAIENQILQRKIASQDALLEHTSQQKIKPSILAGVVARPPTSPYDTLVLAAGKKDGIKIGMEVFGNEGTPIGIISSVLEDFSRATLFSSPDVSTDGWVGKDNVGVIIKGAGAGALLVSLARSANIVEGDIVYVPGPGMLPIGRVVRVDSDPRSPVVTLQVLPIINPSSISWVLVRDTGIVQTTFATSTPI